uniref:Wsv457-like protein n=1 Tax=Pasiphaea japonica whispovirus TaxID=2984286 RepID=A0A9C7BNM9_9VIRU|nr:MAG: wsv457-like protein [Pasiphaea japonica whispovirus]
MMFIEILLIIACVVILLLLMLLLIKILYIIFAGKKLSNPEIDNDQPTVSSIYWDDTNQLEYPSHAQYSSTSKTPMVVQINPRGILTKNGSRTIYKFWNRNSNMHEDISTLSTDCLFKLHFFDLKNFQPSSEDIHVPHLKRKECFVVLELYSGGYLHYDIDNLKYYSFDEPDIKNYTTPIEMVKGTDNRFFSLKKTNKELNYILKHMASNNIVVSQSGNMRPLIKMREHSKTPDETNTVTLVQ